MTIDEAIKDSRENDYAQVAEWLEELKFLRTTKETMYREIYNQALEDFLKEICVGCAYLKGLECTNPYGCPCSISQKEVVREVAKLKK